MDTAPLKDRNAKKQKVEIGRSPPETDLEQAEAKLNELQSSYENLKRSPDFFDLRNESGWWGVWRTFESLEKYLKKALKNKTLYRYFLMRLDPTLDALQKWHDEPSKATLRSYIQAKAFFIHPSLVQLVENNNGLKQFINSN